jgi:hypothetical protein
MKSKIFVLLSLLFGLSFSSCVSTYHANLAKDSNKSSLELYMSSIPTKKYVEIAYIQADGAIFHTPQKLLNGLVKKATELNADAVIQIQYDFQFWYPVASGVAIKYVE